MRLNQRVVELTDPGLRDSLCEALEGSRVVVFPTDTVYGVGGNPWDQRVVRRVRSIKQRPTDQPFSVHVASVKAAQEIAIWDDWTESVLHTYLPGPYTFLLHASDKAPDAAIKEGKIGVRVPDHPFFSDVVRSVGAPLFGTSVNRRGEPPLRCVDTIIEQFGSVDLIVVGPVGRQASTIVDLTVRPPRVLRGEPPPGLEVTSRG